MAIEFKVTPSVQGNPWPFTVLVHETEYQTMEARLAVMFADRLVTSGGLGDAMAKMMEQPHDKGASSLKPETVAKIACNLAMALMLEMRGREWIATGPTVEEAMLELERRAWAGER